MENEKKNLFERPDDLRDTDIYGAIKEIEEIRLPVEKGLKVLKLKEIKDLALELLRKNYLITQEKDAAQNIGDQFLDSPYFGFIAYVWDYRETIDKTSLKDYLKLANELIKTGYTVKKG